MATLEVERKYDATTETRIPELTGGLVDAVSEPSTTELHATYYDTEDLALAAARITLRRRTGGADDGWHLKLPSDKESRLEVRRALGRGTRVPIELARAVTTVTLGTPVRPVIELTTTRETRNLLDAEGTVLAEVCDDKVTAERLDAEVPLQHWREVEVELVDGDRSVFKHVGPLLKAAGIRRSKSGSKLQRALGDAAPPHIVPSSDLPKKSAGTALHRYLVAHLTALGEADRAVRTTGASVHDVRVAARRLRTAVTVYRPLLDADRARHVEDELRRLGRELSDIRDLEVVADGLLSALDAESADATVATTTRHVRGGLRAAEKEAKARTQSALKSERYLALLVDLDLLVLDPPWTSLATGRADKVIGRFVHACGRKARRAIKDAESTENAAGTDTTERTAALHKVRKAAKRLRYATEVADGALGGTGERVRARAEALQEVLGAYLDTAHLRDWLRRLSETASPVDAFTLGRIDAQAEMSAAVHEYDYPAVAAALLADKSVGALSK